MIDTSTQNILISECIDAVGLPGFAPAIARLCETASGYTSTLLGAFFEGHPPVILFDNLGDQHCDTTIEPYVAFAYLLDPLYDVFRSGIGDRVVPLADCVPDDFKTSEYYRAFYLETGLSDETSIFIRFNKNACLVLSLGSRDEGFALSNDGYAALQRLLPVVGALCRRHWPTLEPSSIKTKSRLGHHLEKSFDRFGTSVLSDRESEIVRLVLKGHSSKSVARVLGNSPETVKVHRKRIYAKLNIASQGELFSMFIDALSQTPPNATGDPLAYLDRKIEPRPCF